MTLTELIAHTRNYIIDDAAASRVRWEDAALTGWLNEAEQRFARTTRCFIDGDSDITTVTIPAGSARCELDPLILDVLQVHNTSGMKLRKQSARAMVPTRTGGPMYWAQRSSVLVVDLLADEDTVLRLLVHRLPLANMEFAVDEPEIPLQFHSYLCDWAGYRAASAPDMRNDLEYENLSQMLYEKWEREVGEAAREFYRDYRGW